MLASRQNMDNSSSNLSSWLKFFVAIVPAPQELYLRLLYISTSLRTQTRKHRLVSHHLDSLGVYVLQLFV